MTYNTHYIYVPNDKKPAFKQHLLRMQPGALLVLDDVGFAIEMNRALPKTKVVFRAWYPPSHQDGDNSVHTRVKDPREMLYMYQSIIPASEDIYLHFGNEPGASDELFDWSYEAARYTEEAKRWGCYYNASVGTPEKADWQRPSAQRFLRKITDNPARHVLGLHQYIPTLMNHEFGFQTNPALWPSKWNGSSYLIGRHRELYEVCDSLSIPRPRIILTEFGFDFIHAVQGWQQSLPKTPSNPEIGAVWANIEAWKQAMPSGWTWQQYMVEQMHWCWRAIYRHDTIEGICIYCYGSEGRWTAYDHKDIPDLFPLMEARNWKPMTTTTPPTPTVTPTHYISATGASGSNVRSEPYTNKRVEHVISAAGELAKYIDSKAMADGYAWDEYAFLNGKRGHVRSDVRKHVALKPSVLLNVPYRSQTTAGALKWNNDCAYACIAMLMEFHGVVKTVDEIAAKGGMTVDAAQSFKQAKQAAAAFGFETEPRPNTQLVDIIASLHAGKPMMTLVNYMHLRGGNASFNYGHFVVPVGYEFKGGALTIIVNDPYNAASMRFSSATFAKAIGDMAGTGNGAFQSLFVTGTPQPVDPTPTDPPPGVHLATIRQHAIEIRDNAAEIVRIVDTLPG